MRLALLPAASNRELRGEAASLGDRAVFVPRTQRWFMARRIDSSLTMTLDIGRIDGGVGTSDAARAAFIDMVEARSPVHVGMMFTVHGEMGPFTAPVVSVQLSGRRMVA